MSTPSPLVELDALTKSYREGNQERTVLQDVSLRLAKGDFSVLMGRSGAGKSTLLNLISGIDRPTSGRVRIGDTDLTDKTETERTRFRRAHVGFVFQSFNLISTLTVGENVRLPLEEFTELTDKAMDMAAMLKLRLVGVADAARQMPADLSGGMQKRVALARAAAMDPSILFLDEPSEGLDPVASGQLDRLIVDLSQNLDTTFVIISHKLSTIFHVADRAALFHEEEKGVIARGKPARLRDEAEDPRVRTFFRSDVEASEP